MIDTERVKKMTQLALREKRAGQKLDVTTVPDRKEFVSYYEVRAFFSGTVMYAVILVCVLLCVFSAVTVAVTRLNALVTVIAGILGYLFFLMFYLARARKHTIERYRTYLKTIREQEADFEDLAEIYRREEMESHGQESLR